MPYCCFNNNVYKFLLQSITISFMKMQKPVVQQVTDYKVQQKRKRDHVSLKSTLSAISNVSDKAQQDFFCNW